MHVKTCSCACHPHVPAVTGGNMPSGTGASTVWGIDAMVLLPSGTGASTSLPSSWRAADHVDGTPPIAGVFDADSDGAPVVVVVSYDADGAPVVVVVSYGADGAPVAASSDRPAATAELSSSA